MLGRLELRQRPVGELSQQFSASHRATLAGPRRPFELNPHADPTCGTTKTPICLPVIGTEGIAQVDDLSLPASGAVA
jgi:hypothetical protein